MGQESTSNGEIPQGHVYLLLLEGNRFYIGYTRDLDRRLAQHWAGEGSIATRQYKPVKVLLTAPGTLETERRWYEACRDHWGSGRVRGSYHCERFHIWES